MADADALPSILVDATLVPMLLEPLATLDDGEPVDVVLNVLELELVLPVADVVALPLDAVPVADVEKSTRPVISNWLCGGGGTVPDAMLIAVDAELAVVLVPEPLDAAVLLKLADASDAVQLALVPEVAAWYSSAPFSMPAGSPAPAHPVRSMPTPSGRPARGRR